jgi:hypothetical protein
LPLVAPAQIPNVAEKVQAGVKRAKELEAEYNKQNQQIQAAAANTTVVAANLALKTVR